jgi:DNA-binding winged helix-turn-helix (wHTH) protein
MQPLGTRLTFTFGEFTLDAAARRLSRSGEPLVVSDRHLDVLVALVAHAGSVVSKDALVEAAWRDVAVTDNSLEQAISALRRALGRDAAGRSAIETVPRQGYRFVAPVTRTHAEASDADLEARLAPHRAWLDGRAALETLAQRRLVDAERAFRSAIATRPDLASGHLGLANALAFRFESTRADEAPDEAALAEALTCARIACRLDPDAGEPFATLGFVLHRAGQAGEALVAMRQALAVEPDNWRHHLRLAFVSWGEERLRAAARTLQLLPGLALAHWLAATVHVARQAFGAALRELDAGADAQDEQRLDGGRFPAVGLHWLRGLVRLRLGDDEAGLASLERELAHESVQHLYSRECCANVWYAIGAVRVRHGAAADAVRAFDEAIRRVPGHPMATAARLVLGMLPSPQADASNPRGDMPTRPATPLPRRGAPVEAAIGTSLVDAARGRHDAAAARVLRALRQAPPGPAGWFLPVEPLLDPHARAEAWRAVLALLRDRAA